MNGKRAKRLRRIAEGLAHEFVKTRVLSEEQYATLSGKEYLSVIPYTTMLRDGGVIKQAFGTLRFFYKAVKKRESITYQELDDAVYK